MPSALLLPSLNSFALSSRFAGAALELAQSLTASTLLDVHLPSVDDVYTTCLNAMSAMLTDGLKLVASDVDLTRCYRGHGSRLVEASHLVNLAGAPASPPSYDELGPTPPPPEVEGKAAPPQFARETNTNIKCRATAKESSERIYRCSASR